MKRRLLLTIGTALAVGLLASSAAAAGPGSGNGGGGGGGGKPPTGEETSNNLSVPAIFVGGLVGTPTCTVADDYVAPDPLEESTEFPGYFVQGEAIWQADCDTAASGAMSVAAAWGDNLTSAPLKQRTPVRVELGLLAQGVAPMTGFVVEKLTPELLDRYATYGTDGVPVAMSEVRVWTAVATLHIERADGLVVYDGPFTAEINSTGRVVYGYNWQKPVAGEYTITVTLPDVTITSVDAGEFTATEVSLDVDIAASAGRGGGGGKGGGKPN